MKTLSTSASVALARAFLHPIVLVVLTTYTSRAAATVDKVYYFASVPVLYDYGNTGTVRQFEPLLLGMTDLEEAIQHVPPAPGAGAPGLSHELRLTIANLDYQGGDTLIEELRAHHLPFASVEVATVYGLLDPDTGWYDLRSLTGDEHVVDFRGEVIHPEGIDDEKFQILAESKEIQPGWLFATDEETVDPKDLGQRLPCPFGSARRVPCVNLVVGWTTTFAQPLAAAGGAGTVFAVTDTTGFPTTAFIARANGEELAIASRGSVTDPLVVSARAQNGTSAVDHAAGTVILEVPDETVVSVAGYAVDEISALYLENPYNGELFLVTQHTANVADDEAVSGAVTATARFDQAQLRSLLAACQEASRVAQQAEYATAGDLEVQVHQPNSAGNIEASDFATPLRSWTVSGPSPQVAFTNTTVVGTNGEMRLTFGGLPSGITVLSARLVFTGTMNCVGVFGGGGVRFIRIHRQGLPGFSNGSSDSPTFDANAQSQRAWSVNGSIPGGGVDLASFNGAYLKMSANLPFAGSNGANFARLDSGWGLEITYQDGGGLATRIVDARVEGASVGFGLNFYADVRGPVVPTIYSAGHAFDSVSSVSDSGCTLTADNVVKSEGAASWQLVADETLVEDFESASGWSTTGGITVHLDTGEKTEGSGSNYWTSTAPPDAIIRQQYKAGLSPIDFTDKLIALDVRIQDQAIYDYMATYGLTNTTGFVIGVSSDAAYATHYKQWTFGRNAIPRPGEWFTLIFDPATFPLYASGGTLDLANVRGYQFGFQPTTTHVAATFHLDRFRLLPKTMAAQLNATAGVVDLSADADQYRIALRAGTSADFTAGAVYFSDTGGSGTTAPANRRTLPFSAGSAGVGEWADLAVTAVDVGTPDETDVETIGITVTLPSAPTATLIDLPTVWVDDLRRRDDSASGYSASAGELIEHPADVARWFNVELCGQDADFPDAATFAAAVTNLPGLKLAGDFRDLGLLWPEVMTALGWNSRANFLRSEASSGPRLKMLTAEADHTFEAASGDTITDAGRTWEEGRDGRELATRFRYRYARDYSRGDGGDAYDGLIVASPLVSDVAIDASTLEALEAEWGRRDAPLAVFDAIQDPDTAIDVSGYYVAEAIRHDAGVLVFERAAWWQNPGSEPGDVRIAYARWRGDTKSRIALTRKRFFSGLIDLRLAKVT